MWFWFYETAVFSFVIILEVMVTPYPTKIYFHYSLCRLLQCIVFGLPYSSIQYHPPPSSSVHVPHVLLVYPVSIFLLTPSFWNLSFFTPFSHVTTSSVFSLCPHALAEGLETSQSRSIFPSYLPALLLSYIILPIMFSSIYIKCHQRAWLIYKSPLGLKQSRKIWLMRGVSQEKRAYVLQESSTCCIIYLNNNEEISNL